MRKFHALLLLNFKAMLFSFQVGGRSRRRAFSGIGALLLMGGLALYLSCVYSFLFASQLAPIGLLPLLMMMIPVMVLVAGVFFTLFAAQGIVFGGRDNDLMLSLPISPFLLLLSRVLALYLENLIFSLFIMLPAGGAYLYYGGGGGLPFLLTLLICIPFLALLPTLLSLVCGFLLSWLSSKAARKTAITLVLYLLLLILALIGALRVNLLIADLAQSAAGIQQSLSTWALPFLLMKEAVCDGDFLSLLLFCALCLLPFLALVWLFSGQYKKIITGLAARGARSDYRLGRVRSGTQRRALLKKEAARFFGTPIYLFNAGLGLLFLLSGGVLSLVFSGRLTELLSQLGGLTAALPLPLLLAAAVCFLLSTVAITASSVSLEGRQLWILKEAPVSPTVLFAVKVGFQLLLVLPVLLCSTACLSAALALAWWEWLLVLLPCGAFAAASALLGLYLNLCFPRLDASNDTVVVKQSAAAMLGAFLPMLAVAAAALLYLALRPLVNHVWFLLLCALLFSLCALAFAQLLHRRGPALFARL